MGDPRKNRKTFKKPSHPWQKSRIDEEKELKRKYNYKNKKELWKLNTILGKYRTQARRLIPLEGTKQGDLEREQLITKLNSYGLVTSKSGIDDVLNLQLTDFLDRRLQTLLFNKGYCNTIKQARQLVVHGHVFIAGTKLTSPSYLVTIQEEKNIKLKKEISEKILTKTVLVEEKPETKTEKKPAEVKS